MGKISVAVVPQDVPGNASREVFQGLFKDLGKQAMALEAILRAVCGRVDKMENWLTEVSFGMTELDLQLRNIAHNIDGTAAVDDKAQGMHRWAIPSLDEDKPVAHTMSKKLGTEKKTVRVTGMAANILDQLAASSTPTASVQVEKTSPKKKGKDKKHGTRKDKVNGSTETAVTLLLPVADPRESKSLTSVPMTQPLPVSAVKSTSMTATTNLETSVNTPIDIIQPKTQPDAATVEEILTLPATTEETVVDIPVENDSLTKFEPEVQHLTEIVAQDCEVLKEVSIPLPEPMSNGGLSARNSSRNMSLESQTTVDTKPSVLTKEVLERDRVSHLIDEVKDNVTSIPKVITSPAPEFNTQPSTVEPTTPTVSDSSTSMTAKTTPVTSLTNKLNDKPRMPTPSVSTILPVVQVERTIDKFVLTTPVAAPLPSNNPSATSSPSNLPAEILPTRSFNEETMVIDPVSTLESVTPQHLTPPAQNSIPKTAQQSTGLIKTVGTPIRALPPHKYKPESSELTETTTTDPLLSRRASTRRRSSKMVPRTSFNKKYEMNEHELTRRLSGIKRESSSRRASVSLQQKPQEQETQEVFLQQATLVTPPIKVEEADSTSQVTNTTEQADIEEISDESSSESSSDGSDSSSDDEDDEEAGAAVDEISRTMTALKKLKKAHMLSPEEEIELKERAHKKWFQLKGHIKEKQKKDVTNILLKRKKNVFTVSSRIELLEEKSRELFAGLKQMTNEMKDKNDRSTHETLRRRVTDIEQNLLSVDSKLASLSMPAMDKVSDLESEVASIRTTVQLQLTTAQSEATARHSLLEQALASQRALIEAFAQDVPTQLQAQTELFLEKLKQQPDYHAAIETLKRGLRRKADLKLLKELEARLLGLDAETEDCLVRCLSCHKEVVNIHNDREFETNEQEIGNAGNGPSQLRKVNPGPSSARIYRSNIPFTAQPLTQNSILEECLNMPLVRPSTESNLLVMTDSELQQQFQSAGDSLASEKAPAVRVPSVKWSTPTEVSLKREVKSAKASPLSLMNIRATRAILSPDRPISAPVLQMKKKNSMGRSKSLLKSLTPPQ